MANERKSLGKTLGILAVVIGLGAGWAMLNKKDPPPLTSSYLAVATPNEQERKRAVDKALEAMASETDWPQSPAELIREFWKAASRKDWARMALLCPGATAEEFKGYYDQWTPSPAKGVGAPQPHPDFPDTKLYPARVPFPRYPNKTIKMAVIESPAGRCVIHGGRTIWW